MSYLKLNCTIWWFDLFINDLKAIFSIALDFELELEEKQVKQKWKS